MQQKQWAFFGPLLKLMIRCDKPTSSPSIKGSMSWIWIECFSFLVLVCWCYIKTERNTLHDTLWWYQMVVYNSYTRKDGRVDIGKQTCKELRYKQSTRPRCVCIHGDTMCIRARQFWCRVCIPSASDVLWWGWTNTQQFTLFLIRMHAARRSNYKILYLYWTVDYSGCITPRSDGGNLIQTACKSNTNRMKGVSHRLTLNEGKRSTDQTAR